MKCNRYAIYGWKSKRTMGNKNKLKVLGSIKERSDTSSLPKGILFLTSHIEECNGEIESKIELEYQGSYEGEPLFIDAGIGVSFRCKNCGYEYAGNENGLPYDVDSLNKFLTEVISKL